MAVRAVREPRDHLRDTHTLPSGGRCLGASLLGRNARAPASLRIARCAHAMVALHALCSCADRLAISSATRTLSRDIQPRLLSPEARGCAARAAGSVPGAARPDEARAGLME